MENLRFDRHAEHRQNRLRGSHSRQVRGSAGPGDEHFQTARLCCAPVFEKEIRRTVSGNDAYLVGHAQCGQVAAAWLIVAQSLREPMMMPTSDCMNDSL